MIKKKYVALAVVFLVLLVLIYLQFRTWRNFDWARLFQYGLSWRHIVHGIVYIFIAYLLRAVRWKIFLKPVRKDASILGLIPPTLIGFTGLALLGRPGEVIRPYLIARRENLPFSSQMGVWAVERIFDIGAFTILMVLAIFVVPAAMQSIPHPEYYHEFRVGGFILVGLVAGLVGAAAIVGRSGDAIAAWVEKRFAHRG